MSENTIVEILIDVLQDLMYILVYTGGIMAFIELYYTDFYN